MEDFAGDVIGEKIQFSDRGSKERGRLIKWKWFSLSSSFICMSVCLSIFILFLFFSLSIRSVILRGSLIKNGIHVFKLDRRSMVF